MYDFKIDAADKPALYRELIEAADALTADEPDAIANMANVAALLWESLPDLNWAGFYRHVGRAPRPPGAPRPPPPARVPRGGGGGAGPPAPPPAPQRAADVHDFPGHIAC